MFPYKPSTSGIYPYFPNCIVRNITLFDTDFQYRLDRIREDQTTLYKCCRTPFGYYIDYTSCYYRPTRDQYWEYYDATNFVVYCETGYVMTGMARKINPYDNEYHLEWIQCCRVGFLPVATMLAPPTPAIQSGSLHNHRRSGYG
ncbi:hypothetical protein RvY_06856-2 [Ramazzottius varieornatus]|uniref:Uncharacterized protein n=1 Tax=Ramazzottius varieornatus TaxID=947166 RepID=A0A1D1V022_RAMVA|nr:hypothetical protein RvY_06856-2 [Ramazzottius varieornatus]